MTVMSIGQACACVPEGGSIRDDFHQLRLMAKDSLTHEVKRLYVLRGEEIPKSIEHDGVTYTFGQVSGPAMSIVWFE